MSGKKYFIMEYYSEKKSYYLLFYKLFEGDNAFYKSKVFGPKTTLEKLKKNWSKSVKLLVNSQKYHWATRWKIGLVWEYVGIYI